MKRGELQGLWLSNNASRARPQNSNSLPLTALMQPRVCSLLGLAVTGGPVVMIWWTVPCDADLEIKEGLLRSGYSDKMFLKLRMFASTVRIEGCTIFEKHKE
ncbi:hypothetical protein TNCV_1567361 [Trichonephila clavipes]|nr:hypothetical protein TNCV_1567361 [Trichonephila clavipes]